jgi:hypothetical protein
METLDYKCLVETTIITTTTVSSKPQKVCKTTEENNDSFLLVEPNRVEMSSGETFKWSASNWVEDRGMHHYFKMDNGVLTVNDHGLYFVYAQVSFVNVIREFLFTEFMPTLRSFTHRPITSMDTAFITIIQW